MKIILVGHPGSQHIVPASKYLTSKYLQNFEITYLNYEGPIEGWALFVIRHLQEIEDKCVIFALDDYLISAPIDDDRYREAEIAIRLGGIVCIKLCQSTVQEHLEYPATTQYCLWDREYLIWLLSQVDTPWEFELKGSEIFNTQLVKSILMPCIEYFTNSSLSGRWKGVNLTGVKEEDIAVLREKGLLRKETTDVVASSTSKIVVFGGSGFLGNALIERLISEGHKNITAVARNEGKLVALKEKFPLVQIMVGDVADQWIVQKAMQNADEVYILSAMKHVGLAEQQVRSCISSNIAGTMNVVNESLISKPKTIVFISSDKAAQGGGIYGASKKIGERLMAEAEGMNPDTKYRVIRYGNVWGSTGSIATKWKPKMEKGEEVIITDRKASRFFWTVEEAVDLIFECLSQATSAEPFIPKMKAVSMGTVLDACMEAWGRSPVKEIGLQPGENLVETTDGKVFSDQCEQFTKAEFIEKFLMPPIQDSIDESWRHIAKIISRPKKISCILITREKEYPKIVAERLDTGFFDEIIVVTECESIYHRYLAAMKASNDIIYVQDDDCMVNYQHLFLYYGSGDLITNAMPKEFVEKYKETGCTLVGWGCYFPKSMLEGAFDKYIAQFGVDAHLLREADRIFTYLNQPFNTVIMPHEDLPQNGKKMSDDPDHYTSMDKALLKAMGFYSPK